MYCIKEITSTNLYLLPSLLGNTRVVGQKELEFFRDELETRLSSNYNVILKGKNLPMSLLTDHQKVRSFSIYKVLNIVVRRGAENVVSQHPVELNCISTCLVHLV